MFRFGLILAASVAAPLVAIAEVPASTPDGQRLDAVPPSERVQIEKQAFIRGCHGRAVNANKQSLLSVDAYCGCIADNVQIYVPKTEYEQVAKMNPGSSAEEVAKVSPKFVIVAKMCEDLKSQI